MKVDWRSKYDFACSFSEGRAKVKLKGKCGFVDRIPLRYEDTCYFSEVEKNKANLSKADRR